MEILKWYASSSPVTDSCYMSCQDMHMQCTFFVRLQKIILLFCANCKFPGIFLLFDICSSCLYLLLPHVSIRAKTLLATRARDWKLKFLLPLLQYSIPSSSSSHCKFFFGLGKKNLLANVLSLC